MADIEIEINGQKLTAKPEQTVIEVADAAGIYIPRFCYHKHLSVAANCRMCLVEVEKSPKTLPACATPVMPGMKVFTKSQKTIDAQRAVMEFLLINHPLDCPICDQGGECELQDLSMGYGSSHSYYDECKRATPDEDIGPLIETEMTRCIYCTRCVRFGDEVAGMRELGGTYRGEHTEIGTFVKHAMESEVSGNIIDLCPVGALTSKPYRFTARAWELQQSPGISPHDCFGSNLNVHTRYGEVMRVVSRENLAINEMWLSDRDRFSYAGLYPADRLQEPMAKVNGEWQQVEWRKAFELAAAGLHEVIAKEGNDQLGALASPSATLEEFYLLQKIMRGLGTSNIDHRLRATDTSDQAAMAAFPGLSISIDELEQCDAILLIGSNLQKEQPLAAIRLRKAIKKGAVVLVVNPMDYDFNFKVAAKKIAAPHAMPAALASILHVLTGKENAADKAATAVAEPLRDKKKVCVLLGALAINHPQASALHALAQKIAALSNATVGLMTEGANAAGAWLAGAIPHRKAAGATASPTGLSARDMLEKPRKAYLLLNVEPELDCSNAALATAAMQQANFVVALSLYRNPVLEAHANVIFPMAPFTETSGTYVNLTGTWQSFTGVAKPFGASRPAWKILRVLANFLHLDGFDYESSEEVRHELKTLIEKTPAVAQQPLTDNMLAAAQGNISRIGEIPLYAVDSLVRRSGPLQTAQTITEGDVTVVRLHSDTAKKLKLHDGDVVRMTQSSGSGRLTVRIDERVAPDAAWLAGGITATDTMGDLFGELEITKDE